MEYTLHAITVYTFVSFMNLHVLCTCAVYSTFLNASTDTVSYAVRDQNFFRKGEGGKTRS